MTTETETWASGPAPSLTHSTLLGRSPDIVEPCLPNGCNQENGLRAAGKDWRGRHTGCCAWSTLGEGQHDGPVKWQQGWPELGASEGSGGQLRIQGSFLGPKIDWGDG